MSDHSQPQLGTQYDTFLTQLSSRIDDAMKQNRGIVPSNPPVGTVQFDTATSSWVYNSGTTTSPVWTSLAATFGINVSTAQKWTTARTFSASGGDASVSSSSFDGSANGTLTITLNTSGVTGFGSPVGSPSVIPVITYDAKGRLTGVTTTAVSQAFNAVAITGGNISATNITLLGAATPASGAGIITWDSDGTILSVGNGSTVNTYLADAQAGTITNKTFGSGNTWNGNNIALSYLGTVAAATVLGRNAASTGTMAPIVGTANQVLRVHPLDGTLAFGQLNLSAAAAVTGTLGTTYGGTNLTAFNANGALYATSSSVLTTGTLPIASGGTNSTASPTAGGIAYGSGTAILITQAGSSNQVLLSGAAGAPTWANQNTLAVSSAATATTATNISGGTMSGTTLTASSSVMFTGGVAQVEEANTATTNYYDGPYLNIRNTSATANNFTAIRLLSANNNDYAAIWGICAVHTAGTATGSLVFGTNAAGAAAVERMRVVTAGLNLASGHVLQINGTQVLSATTLGTGVTASSLTSLGNLTTLTVTGATSFTGATAVTAGNTSSTLGLNVLASGTAIANPIAQFGNASIAGGLQVYNTSGTTWGLNALSSRTLEFSTNQTPRVQVGSAGHVTILDGNNLYVGTDEAGGAGTLVLRPMDGTNEGGELVILGAGAFTDWNIDANQHYLRVLGGSGAMIINGSNGRVQFGTNQVPSMGIHLTGAGEVADFTFNPGGNVGASIFVDDSSGASHNGGAVVFGALGSTRSFAAVKGGITNGSLSYAVGNLNFYVRTDGAVSTMALAARITGGGGSGIPTFGINTTGTSQGGSGPLPLFVNNPVAHGGTIGNIAELALFRAGDTNNNSIRLYAYRNATGSTHTQGEHRIERYIDSTSMGYLGLTSGELHLGYTGTAYLKMSSAGKFAIGGTVNASYHLSLLSSTNASSSLLLLENASTGASADSRIAHGCGGRYVTRIVNYSNNHYHQQGAAGGITKKYTDFDNQYFRNIAQTNLLTLNSTGAFGVGSGTSYGNAGEVLKSNGSGSAVSWTPITPSALAPTVSTQTGSFTAAANNHYCLTGGSAQTVTMAAAPTVGDIVWITVCNALATNIINPNGKNINGDSSSMTLDNPYATLMLRYIDATVQWRII